MMHQLDNGSVLIVIILLGIVSLVLWRMRVASEYSRVMREALKDSAKEAGDASL